MNWVIEIVDRVDNCTNWLPQNKPRYVMGVGYPEDLVVSVALGADMFDCVWPSRTAVSPIQSHSSIPHIVEKKKSNRITNSKIVPPPPALRKRHHLNRKPQPPPRLLHHRLPPHRTRLRMHMLPSRPRRRSRHYTGIHPPCCGEGDGGCASVSPHTFKITRFHSPGSMISRPCPLVLTRVV